MSVQEEIEAHLRSLGIELEKFEHPEFHHVQDTLGEYEKFGIPDNKNLFLRDEKKKRFYLLVCTGDLQIDLKALAQKLGEKRLSFCSPPTIESMLKSYPGAVSPYGLIFDKEAQVEVFVDPQLLKTEFVGFHPNINTKTWKISQSDFLKFLSSLNREIKTLK